MLQLGSLEPPAEARMLAAELKPATSLDDPALYINRELSWLEFNRRVLEEALDTCVPLLERLKFLAILSSNLDEFFMVRVGGLQQKVQAKIAQGSGADRMAPAEQIDRISQAVRQMVTLQYQCLLNDVLPSLEKEGIVIRSLKDLTEADRKHVHELFHREIFPVLTPLAIDPGHPFPHLLNKSLNLAVLLQRPGQADRLFAVVQVPAVLSPLVSLPAEPRPCLHAARNRHSHAPAGAVSGHALDSATVFRVTRNSDFEIDDDEVEDLLKTIEEEVRKRRQGMRSAWKLKPRRRWTWSNA